MITISPKETGYWLRSLPIRYDNHTLKLPGQQELVGNVQAWSTTKIIG